MKFILKNLKFLLFLFVVLQSISVNCQSKIVIQGVVYDEYEYPIPYASIGIVQKNIGTSSTEEGSFKFFVSTNELNDIIEISSIGYESIEITVQDFINTQDKKFILKEKITELGEVSIESPRNIVKKALEAPLRQIAINAGYEGGVMVEKVKSEKGNVGLNAATGDTTDLVKEGVIDPAKVTRSTVQNATSIASLVLTTEALVAEEPEDEPAMPAGGMGGMEGMM